MMNMTEFNRKESTKSVGQLYPVLLSKDGQVIDGFHRLEDNPGWKTETLDHIDSEEKLLLARAISNWHRREVPRSEKGEWINGLAKLYKEQGYKLQTEFPFANEIKRKIMNETGLSDDTVKDYLLDEFKQKSTRPSSSYKPKVSASQRIETALGPEYVKRHREEIRQEIAEEVKAEVKKEVVEEFREEVKEKLRHDPEFVEEIAKEYQKKKVDDLLTNVLGDEKVDIKAKRKTERYHDMVVSTFYRVMGWGIPMVLAMGKEQWDKTLPYITGIQNRTNFLLAIKPDASIDEQPKEPKIKIQIDQRKIIEAEYQIIEEENPDV